MRNKVKDNGLTDTEERTILFIKNGLSNKDIAEIENISVNAVKYRLWVIYKKIGSTSRIGVIVNDVRLRSVCICGANKRLACPIHYGVKR